MASYRVDISPRSRRVGRFIARVRDELLKAVEEERRAARLNQQMVAEKLGQKRSSINRQLSGEDHLTLRSVAELSWALGREINFELRKPVAEGGQNINTETTTIGWKQPTLVSMSSDIFVNRVKGASGSSHTK
jgi:ribosome-binding protein aMBF1 (putative translation factor)